MSARPAVRSVRKRKARATSDDTLLTVGWREWVALPDLRLPLVKAKVDTGARTSALHAYNVERFTRGGAPWARLYVHPRQRDDETFVVTQVPIVDERTVSDSGGHRERRIVVESDIVLGDRRWRIELTVTNRDSMLFRMLLGRTAMAGRVVVDPKRSYRAGKPERSSDKPGR